MNGWLHTVYGISELITEDETPEYAKKIGKQIYKILTTKENKKFFKNFEYINEFNFITDCDNFNSVLTSFYDYCDFYRIWID